MVATTETSEPQHWLLMFHQLPPQPAYFRVKIWRRLQALGAVAIKNSVYVLPINDQTREDFQWLLREIVQGGGDGSICEAQFIDGLSDEQVRGLFNEARKTDYESLLNDVRELSADIPKPAPSREAQGEYQGRLGKLRKRLSESAALDFFESGGRAAVESALAGVERALHTTAEAEEAMASATEAAGAGSLKNRTWVTRRGIFVDRMASAWLIRRFIDPGATFKFVGAKDYKPAAGELRFDMFEAEFTHEGDHCTFEVLIARAGLEADPGLRVISEIVHDIDLKDGKFGREETSGIALLLEGIATVGADDEHRMARSGAVFDDLYEFFRRRPAADAAARS